MNKIRFLLLFLPFLISISTFGQENRLEELTVGFMCGELPRKTPLVTKMTDLVNNKKYSEISSLLNSKNSGELFLAILVLERLDEKKVYKLSEKELETIGFWKSKPIRVYNCLGCFSDVNLIPELFENKNSIKEVSWLNEILPIE